MFCPNCGKEIDSVNYCPHCGAEVSKYTNVSNDDKVYDYYEPIDNTEYNYHTYDNYVQNDDRPSFWFALLSFFIPIAGIILYIIWHKDYPRKAKSCLKGLITSIILSILTFCCFAAAMAGIEEDYYDDGYYNEFYDEDYYEDDVIDFDFEL